MSSVSLVVRNLGRISYASGIELQKELAIKYQNSNQGVVTDRLFSNNVAYVVVYVYAPGWRSSIL